MAIEYLKLLKMLFNMKLSIQILFIILLFLTFSCCRNSESPEYALTGIQYEDNDNFTCGILDSKGECFIKGLEDKPSPIINGYFVKEVEDGAVLCKVEGNSYTEISKTTGYNEFGVMNNGLIPVCKMEEKIVVLNEEGDVVFSLVSYDGFEVLECASYSSGKLRVKLSNGSILYLDKSGNKSFDKSYEWGTDFINEKAVVCTSDDDYSLITGDGNIVFSFKSADEDFIKVSHEHELICAKDEDDIVTIYDFKGNIVLKCPKKVEEIYSFAKDYFIFKKGSRFGLMNYSGVEVIRAKYEQLMFNGNSLLAIHEDRDDEVLILDKKGATVGTLDGEEIFSAQEYGYAFPIIIKREDDDVYLINEDNELLGAGPLNIEIDLDALEYVSQVRNHYFPVDEVLKIVMDLCGDGSGLPKDQGAFFFEDSTRCNPYNIKLLRNCPKDLLLDKSSYSTTISEGINYSVDFELSFDEPIVKTGESTFNSSACLYGMEIKVFNSNVVQNTAFYNLCRRTLENTYDCEVIVSYDNNYVLSGHKNKNLIILCKNNPYSFKIYLREYTEYRLTYWTNYIKKK